jgi:hypothetical protein
VLNRPTKSSNFLRYQESKPSDESTKWCELEFVVQSMGSTGEGRRAAKTCNSKRMLAQSSFGQFLITVDYIENVDLFKNKIINTFIGPTGHKKGSTGAHNCPKRCHDDQWNPDGHSFLEINSFV